jgi:hypothetical protein
MPDRDPLLTDIQARLLFGLSHLPTDPDRSGLTYHQLSQYERIAPTTLPMLKKTVWQLKNRATPLIRSRTGLHSKTGTGRREDVFFLASENLLTSEVGCGCLYFLYRHPNLWAQRWDLCGSRSSADTAWDLPLDTTDFERLVHLFLSKTGLSVSGTSYSNYFGNQLLGRRGGTQQFEEGKFDEEDEHGENSILIFEQTQSSITEMLTTELTQAHKIGYLVEFPTQSGALQLTPKAFSEIPYFELHHRELIRRRRIFG